MVDEIVRLSKSTIEDSQRTNKNDINAFWNALKNVTTELEDETIDDADESGMNDARTEEEQALSNLTETIMNNDDDP